MVESIAKIGKLVRGGGLQVDKGSTEKLEELIMNIYGKDNKNKQYLLKIVLKKDNDNSYKFVGVDIEDLKEDSCLKSLYRSAGGNAINPSPTAQKTDKDTFGNKILKFFKRASSEENDSKDLFKSIYNALNQEESNIRSQIEEKAKEKANYLITITLIENEKELYLLDKDEFVNYFLNQVEAKESRFSGYGTCSICGKKGEVYGGVFPYAFFNLDKEGFLNKFDKKYSYKNFPICKDCIRDLEEGKKFIENKLQYTFVKGLRYRIIPQNITQDEESFGELIDILKRQDKAISVKILMRITDDEDEILYNLAEKDDTFTLNFLFIEKSNKAEKILALIQDVLPSRLRKIFDAKKKVDDTFKEVLEYEHNFSFGTIRQFFFKNDSNKKETDLDKYFLDLTDKIFKGRRIEKDFLFYYLMKGIREEFVKLGTKEREIFKFKSIDALTVYYFLSVLRLIDIKEVSMEERKFDVFFSKFGNALEDPLKKGLILLGAATQTLLEVQQDKRGSKPFLKYLKSLKMDEKDFKELLPKVQAKLEEYESLPYAKDFLEEASYYLLQAGDKFKMNVSEMNFYFTVGMNLKWEILKSLNKEVKNERN
ncbi:MAG: TIGR02556 family CRISPR-associated protein [Caldisericum sp.]|uniref:TIGR02556 family CRISPR-associated protein n=1 Tax=Caldisericum sp. TaxID=2499687 RepID=UPI003D0C1CFE